MFLKKIRHIDVCAYIYIYVCMHVCIYIYITKFVLLILCIKILNFFFFENYIPKKDPTIKISETRERHDCRANALRT